MWRWRSAAPRQCDCLLAASNYRPIHTAPNSTSRSVGRQSPTEYPKYAIRSPRRYSLQQRQGKRNSTMIIVIVLFLWRRMEKISGCILHDRDSPQTWDGEVFMEKNSLQIK